MAMFGTIMRAQAKPGQRDAFIEAMRRRGSESNNPGFLSAEICREDKDPDRVVAVIHFRDRESYMTNAARPQTDAEYNEMLQYLAGPPEWIDVHYVAYEGEPLSASTLAATAG
jgi:quinol monooxygenase YgiN